MQRHFVNINIIYGLKNYYNIKLLMPKNLTLQNRFKAYVREQGSDGGSSNPLDCFIEN